MFPMIATLDEVVRATSLPAEARTELQYGHEAFAEKVQIGIMVETSSIVLLAERFTCQVDFFSIGTNDLTQYTFTAERGNRQVAHLNDPCHPAVLKEIRQVVTAAHQADIGAGNCG